MWSPPSWAWSFALAVVSLICWGSWGNSTKRAVGVPFSFFYLDFSIAVILVATLTNLTLGGARLLEDDDDPNMKSDKILAAFAAGAIFNVANVFLVAGMSMAGIAVAFPVGVGTALVLGTILTFVVDNGGGDDPGLLFTGVACAFVAVLCNATAHKIMTRRGRRGRSVNLPRPGFLDDDREGPLVGDVSLISDTSFRSNAGLCGSCSFVEDNRPLVICVCAGVLMSLWSPLSAYAMRNGDDGGDGGLSAYGLFLCFSGSILATSIPICYLLFHKPITPEMNESLFTNGRSLIEFFTQLPLSSHGWGMIGGAVWAVGTLSNLISGHEIGLSVSYAIGQSAPMVATAWGAFYFGEFNGAPGTSKVLLGLMFAFYFGSVALIAISK